MASSTKRARAASAKLASVIAARTSQRYPYMLRGRVEIAVFNCPRCNAWLRFRARTAFRKKCPDCQLRMYVFLRVCVSSGRAGSNIGRPVDTILPPLRSDSGQYALRGEQPPAKVIDPKPLDPDPFMPPSLRRARGMPRRDMDPEVGQFVAELGDGSVEPIPAIELGVWGPGDACHEVVDLDGADPSSNDPDDGLGE